MTRLRVALDVQHLYRSGIHAGDRGARFVTSAGRTVWEADYSLAYAQAAGLELVGLGHDVLLNADGTAWGSRFRGPYSVRQQIARAWRADVYIACHVNAGGGSYGRVSWPADSPMRGRCRVVAAVLQQAVAAWGTRRVETLPIGTGERGHVCVAAVPIVPLGAVLLEPFFGDDPIPHALGTMPALGQLLAREISSAADSLKLGAPFDILG